jgi:hypothetical protein
MLFSGGHPRRLTQKLTLKFVMLFSTPEGLKSTFTTPSAGRYGTEMDAKKLRTSATKRNTIPGTQKTFAIASSVIDLDVRL